MPFGWIPIAAANGLVLGMLFGTIVCGTYYDKSFLRTILLRMEDDPFPWNAGSWVGTVVGTIVGWVAGAFLARRDPQGPYCSDE
jgi:hypothetical protein